MSRMIALDREKLRSQIANMKTLTGKKISQLKAETEKASRQVAAEMAEELCEATFPVAGASIGMAAAAVRFDLGKVYITPGRAFEILRDKSPALAGAFYAAWKKGNRARAEQLLRESGTSIARVRITGRLDPNLHEQSRDANGRVSLTEPLQLVEPAELEAYAKVTIARLGKTASGWAACVDRLGGNGNRIAWKGTAVHGSDGGSVSTRNEKNRVLTILTNHRPLAKKLLSAGAAAAAVARAKQKLRSLLRKN